MNIAYLLNQYPYASCTFIRREILHVEKTDVRINRYSIRRPELELVDEQDLKEADRTRIVLDAGHVRLLAAMAIVLTCHPWLFLKTLCAAVSYGWRSDRSVPVHLVYFAEACLLLRMFRADRIDHVHSHFAGNATQVAMLIRRLGGPTFSFTVHGPHDFDQPQSLHLGDKIIHAKFVVGISSFTTSQLYRWCEHKHWKKIHIVRCGVDDAYFGQPDSPVPDTPSFVCIGRFVEQKGQLVLVEAAGRLAKRGKTFSVTFVGDGPLRGAIVKRAAELGIDHMIRLPGWADDRQVRESLLAARALVLPSFAEGLPVVIMEALALRRPVIVTFIAGVPELVDSDCGWIVPPGSVDALANAMQAAMDLGSDALHAMGQVGYARVLRMHCAEQEAGQLAKLFLRYASYESRSEDEFTSEFATAEPVL